MGEALKLVFHMNGGTGKSSYAENSSIQRLIIQKSLHIVRESIKELLLCQYSNSLLPKCMNMADLGCSSGPNAFFAVKEIINSINKTCLERQLNNCQPPSVQVFLNDLTANDFNTLFKMLPNFYDELQKSEGIVDIDEGGGNNYRSCCYVAAVPGSFYGRLFPDHSIYFLHTSNSLHWLSQVPTGLMSKFGEPLNKRNICIAETSPPSVREAYLDQFENDFKTFLKMRSQELVHKGHLVLTFLCKNDEDDGLGLLEILGNTLHDMVTMGMIDDGQLACFNIPLYAPSIEELKEIIEVEGSFTLKRLETFKLKFDANNTDNNLNGGTYVAMYVRAGLESLLTSHFDENCMNDLFEMYGKNISMCLGKGKGILNNVTLQLINEP